MYTFTSENPTRFVFGAGQIKEIGRIAKNLGKRAVIVTYAFPHFTALAEKVTEYLQKEGVDSIVYNQLRAEPSTTDAVAGGLFAAAEACDLVIGLGGGSALDMAKGIAHCAIYKDNITDFMYGKAEGKSALPIILIPTTAGTGSEGNHYAVFTNPETNDKKALITRHLFAKAAILDPELLTSLPPKIIAGPGLDALFHCIEAYFSTDSTLVSEMYSLHGIKLIAQNLRIVYKDPSNVAFWQSMQYASLLGGLAIGAADVGIPHALGHPIGGLYHISHSETLIPTYQAYINYVCDKAPHRAAQLAFALGKEPNGDNIGKICSRAILEIIGAVDMEITLSSIGVQKKDLPWIIENAMTVMGSSIRTTPGNPDKSVLENILKLSF